MKIASVFISKKLEEVSLLSAFCEENKLELEAKSFITFEEIKEDINPNFDIYFFGSKNAFDFFLKRNISLENKQIAVIGESTQKHIETLGYEVTFYGKEAGSPQLVAEEISHWLKGRKITFFQSDISKRSIASYLPENQKEEFVIYRTRSLCQKLNKSFDLYVFTSPSNVKSFLEQNVLPNEAKVISWGKSTDAVLKENNIPTFYSLKKASLDELLEFTAGLV
ncbi:MAG: uroporphyrinogen-III synthase [Flavobacteriia bacterium]|jgi:uroporphyrinogen-III synthase